MALTTPALPASGTAVVNNTGQNATATVTGGTVQGVLLTPIPAPVVAQPAVPASTGTVTNTNPFPVAVAVATGTVSVIAVNGVTQYTATGNTVVVPANGIVGLTYTVAPTWTWTGLLYGVNGNPLTSPVQVPMYSISAITLIYSAAPTWAWSDPMDVGYTPGYAGENTVLISEISQLPWPAHAVGGETGLGVAVDN